MEHYFVEVAGRRFLIDGQAIDRVRERLMRAARAGGEFVTLGSGDGSRDVLITPGLPVVIQRRVETVDASTDDAAGASTMESIVAPDDQFDDWGI